MARTGQQFQQMESGLFSATELDDANHVERADEIRFCTQHVLRLV
jgi:hypothetical protein